MAITGRPKVSVIGAGHVGSTLAMRIAEAALADVVLVDIVEGMPQGKALDLSQSRPVVLNDVTITGTNDYADIAGSDMVITTAGVPRKPGMSRDDLIEINGKIALTMGENIKKYAPDAFIIQVANPLDAITYVISEITGTPKNKIMGMAGVLDSSRYRHFIAEALGVSVKDVQGIVLGGHGDTMVPLPRFTWVGGAPLPDVMPADQIEAIVERTRKGGAEIVGLLKTGSAYYAPSAGAFEMAKAIIKDEKRILPVAAYLEGEYGISGLFVGVPAVLGKDGIEKIWELPLSDEELAALKNSADHVKALVDKVNELGILG
ncbi:malate dehydrogenase [Oceanithermus profundus]|uniref:Malate dehydrogenase n=1 Tax=Oceanithermus profundus (strain DSM 14977 / NBRC 100410 / VKM B-2274 / 506) TaxID=670487 RepID=E4U8E1_OCEP5|nr:malate dehydrogenase [Oceanithermus profundus]ADR36621.1 malate dehydrogenase (NAD) [Oceanithermus profundus DSM 14977]